MTDHDAIPPHDSGRRPKPRLLIADDSVVVQSVLASQLSGEFDIVAGARDAEEAVALAEQHQPDAAIIDVDMPAGGGVRAALRMQTCAPRTAIVALSADESDAVVREMIEAGAMAYVRKGTPGGELARTLRRSIQAHARFHATSN